MITSQKRFGRRLLRQWRCCDLLWEILLAPRYASRETWTPTCPTCGTVGDLPE